MVVTEFRRDACPDQRWRDPEKVKYGSSSHTEVKKKQRFMAFHDPHFPGAPGCPSEYFVSTDQKWAKPNANPRDLDGIGGGRKRVPDTPSRKQNVS